MEILRPPRALIMKSSGINCDEETAYAFDIAGATSEIVHINQIKSGEYRIGDYQIVVVPGGFSYGDDIAAGRVMALEMGTYLGDQIMEHIDQRGRLLMGICNGFQVLVQSGLLPFGEITSLKNIKASLESNDSGHFESRWIWLVPQESRCEAEKMTSPFSLPVAHGEGKFVTKEETLKQIEENGQVILRYCTREGKVTNSYPENPNGSINGIAGICDPTGRVIGLMPHPERAIESFQSSPPMGLEFIRSIVEMAK